jgi:Ni/Co efflux regulator RcnB
MRKLSFTLLAASTMLIAGVATAQPAPGPRPGASWRGGMQMHGPNMQMRGPNMQMRGPNMQMHGPNMQMHGNMQMHRGNMQNFRFHRWGPRPGHNFRYQRLRRGGFINSFWFAPQFYIGDWGSYGFSAPGDDQRWVRYYDDAYLIDGGGRVMDERYGVDWNRGGGDWEEQDGIPGYRGEWRDSDESADEEYSESEDGAEMRGGDMRGHGGPHGPMMPPPGYGPMPPGTHVYGGGYGYGMYAYPIVIETVTTSGSGGYVEEVTEEYVQTAHRRRVHRPRPRCSCVRPAPRPVVHRPAPRPAPVRRPAPRPRPPAGERG